MIIFKTLKYLRLKTKRVEFMLVFLSMLYVFN